MILQSSVLLWGNFGTHARRSSTFSKCFLFLFEIISLAMASPTLGMS